MSDLTAKKKRGYMYIGHIPHGFYEKQIKGYFSQFGNVKRIRLAMSKNTGKHRGYGFIEFESESVAKIAADTMNNYLMFNKILKCQLIPKEKLHENAFKNSHKLFSVPIKSLFRRKYNKLKSKEQVEVFYLNMI
jgi:nucleolar protein 15